jgi:hypothetical protein
MMDSYSYGTTPEDTILAALPHKYNMSLNCEDMRMLLDALIYYAEDDSGYANPELQDRAASLRTGILTTLGIEEI